MKEIIIVFDTFTIIIRPEADMVLFVFFARSYLCSCEEAIEILKKVRDE